MVFLSEKTEVCNRTCQFGKQIAELKKKDVVGETNGDGD